MNSDPDRFVKVFDVLDSGFKDWKFAAFGLIFVAVGIAIFIFPRILEAVRMPYLPSRSLTFLRYGFLGFALLWTALAFAGTYWVYLRHRALARENQCRLVEGPVERFVLMPYQGHGRESFTVSAVPFTYSDFEVTDAFNNTSSHGGPISGGEYVRICYDPSGNAILRLEIRDFAGERKDYAKGYDLFPNAEDARRLDGKSLPHLAWYDNLFEVLLALDLIAIHALYLPYLRTFFRLKAVLVGDRSLPRALEAGQKIKLRNSLIYWDRDNHAIWLRPRGFGALQIPLTVAKLTVDEYDRSITASEIRFSSIFPFAMILFLWAAGRMFSAELAMWPPTEFLGAIVAMLLVGGFINIRRLRSRMENLVQDALSEIGAM
jgi:hypothetical protein